MSASRTCGARWRRSRRSWKAACGASRASRSASSSPDLLQHELVARRNEAVADVELLDVADRRERHVVAEEGDALGRHHVEDALASLGRPLLVHVEAD